MYFLHIAFLSKVVEFFSLLSFKLSPMDPKNLVYDYENNKIIVDGMVFDGPTSMAEIETVLKRIDDALALRKMVSDETKKKAANPGKGGDGSGGSGSAPGGTTV